MAVLKNIRAQSEVIGLMVIVVILIFLGLIYLGFSNLADTGSYSDERSSIETENALKASMKVNLVGMGKTLEDLIVECSSNPLACNELDGAVERLYRIIMRPGVDYSLFVYMENNEIYSRGTCNLGLVSNHIFVRNMVTYKVSLKLCSND